MIRGAIFFAAMAFSSALSAAMLAPAIGPSLQELDVLRAERAASEAGTQTPGMCRQTRNLSCTGFEEEPTEFSCRYQELNGGTWREKLVTVARDGDRWVWLGGDSPRCVVHEIR